MRKPGLLLLLAIFAPPLEAQFEINAGLSGSWHDPAVDGQGLQVDVVVDQSNLFAAWFTFSHQVPEAGMADHQRWYTLFGPYAGNLAQLTLYKVTGGQINASQDVVTAPSGSATLEFHDCASATFEYVIDDPALSGSIELIRLTPDVFCQELADNQSAAPEYNLPPRVDALTVVKNGNVLAIDFSLDDPENDLLDVQVEIVNLQGGRYRVPEAHLGGHAGYPVIPGESKSVEWRFTEDDSFLALGWDQVAVEVLADDRYVSNLQEIIELVRTDRLIVDLEFMEGVRHHAGNPAHLGATRDYLRSEMNARGISVQNQLFTWQGSQGVNIIGALDGRIDDGSYYAVDAHYDTVTTTPGVDDNATGTAGMLEAMRVLSQFNSETSIRFIGFDKEELGLRGARHYAANIPAGENLLGLINLEMIGYTCRNQPECVNLPNADTTIYNIHSSFTDTLATTFSNIGATHVPALEIVWVPDDGDPNFRRSDHAPFWDIGVDALMIADGANFRNPHYHQPTDTVETLDIEFMTQIVKTTVGTLATMAGVTHTGSMQSGPVSLD